MKNIAPDVFICVEVGSITIQEAAIQAIAIRDHLGVSLKLHFDAGDVFVYPLTDVGDIIADYEELCQQYL